MNRINCVKCRQCNRKGKPSVTRLSKYCNEHYTKEARLSLLGRIKQFLSIKDKMADKRFDEETGKMNTKSFRKDYFERL